MNWEVLKEWMLFGILLISSFSDLKDQKIAVIPVGVAGTIGLIGNMTAGWNCLESVLCFTGGVGLLLLWKISGSVGLGDVWMLTAIGMILGWEASISILLMALIMGSIVGGILLFQKKKNGKDTIPFVPFLLLGYGGYLLLGGG